MRPARLSWAGGWAQKNNGLPSWPMPPSWPLFMIDLEKALKRFLVLFPLSAALFRSEDREPLLGTPSPFSTIGRAMPSIGGDSRRDALTFHGDSP